MSMFALSGDKFVELFDFNAKLVCMVKTSVESQAPAKRPKHAVKRQILLDEAARQINDRGAGAVSLNDIAECAGLSRNALYYYVTDRADLTFQCYLRTCEAATENLAAAYEQGRDAIERIRIYTERTLSFDQPTLAALCDPDFLPEPHRATILDLHRRNIETLENFIQDGISEGVIRPTHTEIAAQTLHGMINWTQLSHKWLNQKDGNALRKRLTGAILDLFFFGLAASEGKKFSCPVDVVTLTTRPFNAFDRAQATQEKIAQLVAAASRMFNRRGIDGASLDDISASVGATKGAVYHYFDDKMDLITQCYERAFDLYSMFVDVAVAQGTTGFERSMIVMHLNSQAQAGPTPPLMLQPGLLSVPESHRARFVQQSLDIWRRCEALIRQGIEDGTCRPCDARAVSSVSAGSFLWLHKWLPEDYALTPFQLADTQCRILINGIACR
ncbi:TetR/AcrR family transcriptional regulator [Sphingorhabdus contaminans]|uniref:TetR/AcrR family transcriptional regulator n=1 Tax=Sphingorhabdus contaminans TaxID=1343899 RepID=UPI003D2C4748